MLTFWSKSKVQLVKAFSFSHFFFFAGDSNRVRFTGWSNQLVEDEIISDIMMLEGTSTHVARVSTWLLSVRESDDVNAEVVEGMWWRMAVFLVSNFSGFVDLRP